MADATVFAEMIRDGWIFEYEPGTAFVGARHPKGGRQSICEASREYGPAIADTIRRLGIPLPTDSVPIEKE